MNERTILLVEDNANDEALTLRAFQLNDIKNPVVVARDGVEALEYLFGTGAYAGRDARVLPELVLLDLNLPKVSGQEVLRRLRADMRTKMVPVVVLTNSKEELDVVASYSHGANSYVRKPVDFLEFMSLVRTLSQYWLVVNVNPLQKPGG